MCNTACGRMCWPRSKNPTNDLQSSSVLLSDESCGSRSLHVNSFNSFGLSGCVRLYCRRSLTFLSLSQCLIESIAWKYFIDIGPKISSHSLSVYGLLLRTAVRMRIRDDPAIKTCSRTRECVSVSKMEARDPSTCIVRNTTNTLSSAVKPTWDVICVSGTMCQVLCARYCVSGTMCQILCVRYYMPGTMCQVLCVR